MEVKYTMMPENTSLGSNQTVIQACFEALGRAGYEEARANTLSSMLYDAVSDVLEQHGLRTVFSVVEGPYPLFSHLVEMAKLDSQPKASQVVSIKALAHQFALQIPNQVRNHLMQSFYHRDVIRIKLRPSEPIEILRTMQELYRINAAKTPEPSFITKRKLELEYHHCSVDEIYEVAKVYNKQVEDAGSWPAFVFGLVKDSYDIIHLDDSQLKQEAKYPRVPALVWTDPKKPVEGGCGYDHVEAETQFGIIRIEWKSWKEHDTFSFSMPFEIDGSPTHHYGSNLEEAKALAYSWYNHYMQKAFGYNVRTPE